MNRQRGFTLIELMIVLVVMAVLIGIAYPSYVKQVQKTKRAECAGGLLQLANAMEREFSQNNGYSNIVAGGGFVGGCPIDGGTRTYNFSINSTTTTYTLTATPTGGQVGDDCGWLSLSNTGVKNSQFGTLNNCWR